MGRVYQTTGIGISFGGTSTPSNNLRFESGTWTADWYLQNNGKLTIESPLLAGTLSIENDNGDINVFAGEGVIECMIGNNANNGLFRIRQGSGGGTLMELDPDGNLSIAGTIKENTSF